MLNSDFFRTYAFRGLLLLALLLAAHGALGQVVVGGGVSAVSPDSAEQGTSGLTVTFTLNASASPPPPPSQVLPQAMRIGTIEGSSISRNGDNVSASFDIPAGESVGAKDCDVEFAAPPGQTEDMVFRLSDGFDVTGPPSTAPTVAITSPAGDLVLDPAVTSQAFAGTASDPDGSVVRIEYQHNAGAWQTASGTTSWNFSVDLAEGDNTVAVRGIDNLDNVGETVSRSVYRGRDNTGLTYVLPDTGQVACYDASSEIDQPAPGEPFFGQDAQITRNPPSYTLSADGYTVLDNHTGLTWTQSPDLNGDGSIDSTDKLLFSEFLDYPDTLNAMNYGGYSDWRAPTIKELYSLIDFRGTDPMVEGDDTTGLIPFIDTNYFGFDYGDTGAGERVIDAQFWSATEYVSTTMGGSATTFGVNFADGRIKGYGRQDAMGIDFMDQYAIFVRGNTAYGLNDFIDNGDGTVTDAATGLMWMQDDSGTGMDWESALAWVETKNAEVYLGYSDWRLPNAKELQSIVDYSRSPDTTSSPAIDPVFNCTQIINLADEVDYPWYWTGTTHYSATGSGGHGAYVCFGRGMGSMDGTNAIDVHGAGCQRSDPKSGDPANYPVISNGPQGDVQRVFNHVRLVRDAEGSGGVADGEPFEGYNLFGALNETTAWLTDNDGNVVHSWETGYRPGNAMYLLEDGELLRTCNLNNSVFNAGGSGGRIQTQDWDGNVTWTFEYSSAAYCQHHDVEMLPNGNLLMIAWQYKSEAEALAAGRDPSLIGEGALWPDSVIEVQPTGADSGTIVWEWHVWDHLVQDYDAGKNNYGVVADHPELIDLNFARSGLADWTHINSIDYNAVLDQIVLSVHGFSEIWVIDHSTSTEEAAGHTGGNAGKGGDLLYRWGNPQAYGAGDAGDQQLFVQHDAEWIEEGLPGAGNILIFNNGQGRPAGNYSSIEEITPPLDGYLYTLTPGEAWGPTSPAWTYSADNPTDFYAQNISGSQRLPNGNTLICEGPSAYFFEVTDTGQTVWEHTHTGAVFRVERYPLDYAGFDGTPLDDEERELASVAVWAQYQ